MRKIATLNSSIRRHSAALLLPLALLAVGCHTASNPDVVATVSGHTIMRTDMEKGYTAQLSQAQQQTPPPQDQADAVRLQVLRELIDEEIVDQAATKMNLTATEAEVDAKVAEMKAPYSEEQFSQQLKSSGRTVDDLRHEIRRALTQDKLFNKEVNSKITITDANVHDFFNANRAQFNLRETQYRLAQIQVTSLPTPVNNLQNSKAANEADAKKKIQALKTRLDSGDDFSTLAQSFSENPETTPNGGDMGFVTESDMRQDPTIYTAVMKLKSGQITDILPLFDPQKRPVGYSIFKLLDREPAGQREITDPTVQQHIRQQLHDTRAQLLKGAYIEMLRDQAKVRNFFAEQVLKNDAR